MPSGEIHDDMTPAEDKTSLPTARTSKRTGDGGAIHAPSQQGGRHESGMDVCIEHGLSIHCKILWIK